MSVTIKLQEVDVNKAGSWSLVTAMRVATKLFRKLIRDLFLPPLLQTNTTNKVALKQTAFHNLWLRYSDA